MQSQFHAIKHCLEAAKTLSGRIIAWQPLHQKIRSYKKYHRQNSWHSIFRMKVPNNQNILNPSDPDAIKFRRWFRVQYSLFVMIVGISCLHVQTCTMCFLDITSGKTTTTTTTTIVLRRFLNSAWVKEWLTLDIEMVQLIEVMQAVIILCSQKLKWEVESVPNWVQIWYKATCTASWRIKLNCKIRRNLRICH